MLFRRAAFSASLFLITATFVQAAQSVHADTEQEKQVDGLFSKWNKPNSPGAVVGVFKDGKIVYEHGYGLADIEHNIPISSETDFHIASMSKQFTAMDILLLAQDGKLSLDDDIRKYLPELHDFGKVITIRNLLNHTSGLRDQWNLLMLAGWRLEDVITEDDILKILSRQSALNFAPGEKYLYSNSGYTLLGVIVKRVSGQSLAQFTHDRIFEPLGMNHSRFQEQYGTLIKNRALSYEPNGDGVYDYVALSYSNAGATSLHTTVEDLLRWDENFYTGKVGGKELLAQMQTKGKLNDGREIDYADGLSIGKYRGLDTVDHGGADAGYRTQLLRFPAQHVSIVVLANAGDASPGKLAHDVADIYLGKQLAPAPEAAAKKQGAPVEIKIDPKYLDALVGEYELAPGFSIAFTNEHGQLMEQATGQSKNPLFPTTSRTFFLKVVDAQVTFDAPDKDGIVSSATLHQDGQDHPLHRVARKAPSADYLARLDLYIGEYYSEELHVLYTVTRKDDELQVTPPRGEVKLSHLDGDNFQSDTLIGRVHFHCPKPGLCDGFDVDNGRVQHLHFDKVTIQRAGPATEK
jgi:CubicO group peptidase (beta-lactamase class C family)